MEKEGEEYSSRSHSPVTGHDAITKVIDEIHPRQSEGSHAKNRLHAHFSKQRDDFPEQAPLVITDREMRLLSSSRRHEKRFMPQDIKRGVLATSSGVYGMLLLVMGAVIPFAEIYEQHKHAIYYEIFYVYLFLGSISFMVYVYVYLLRSRSLKNLGILRTAAMMKSLVSLKQNNENTLLLFRWSPDSVSMAVIALISCHGIITMIATCTGCYLALGTNSVNRRRSNLLLLRSFGMGAMIQNGLLFGSFLSNSVPDYCSVLLEATKPALQMIFTFLQTYFIFSNSKMCINKYQMSAKFGLMHMIATNMCLWLRCIVVESVHQIHAYPEPHLPTHNVTLGSETTRDPKPHTVMLSEIFCATDSVLSNVITHAGPYLYPCVIEYSLISAGVIYVMWRNVGKSNSNRRGSLPRSDEEVKTNHHMSVDCSSSTRGLFFGVLTFVGVILSIIAFYVITKIQHDSYMVTYFSNIAEIVIYVVGIFAVAMAYRRMRILCYFGIVETDLEDHLLIVAVSGVYIFAAFSTVAAPAHDDVCLAFLILTANICLVAQSTLQTIFILNFLRVCVTSVEHEKDKPGRQCVTFLLVFNVSLWILTTFASQSNAHNPVQIKFYGQLAWAIFTHISIPLDIFYRFHSTVLLCTIWKGAWKLRTYC